MDLRSMGIPYTTQTFLINTYIISTCKQFLAKPQFESTLKIFCNKTSLLSLKILEKLCKKLFKWTRFRFRWKFSLKSQTFYQMYCNTLAIVILVRKKKIVILSLRSIISWLFYFYVLDQLVSKECWFWQFFLPENECSC